MFPFVVPAFATEPAKIGAEAHAVALSYEDWAGGVGLGLIGRVAPRAHLEAVGDVGVGATGPIVSVRPQVRAFLTNPDAAVGALSATLGPGLTLKGGVHPDLLAGAGLDLPRVGRVGLRFEGGALVRFDGPVGARLGVAGTLGRRQGPVVPPPAPVDTSDVVAWLPHPLCTFVPVADLPRWRAILGETPVRVSSPGHAALWTDAGAAPPELPPLAVEGSLVVVAWPGDRVTRDGTPVPLGPDAVAELTGPPGPVSLRIEGGGRVHTVDAVTADGYGLWVRAPRPEPLEVTFTAGSSALGAQQRTALQALARHAGDATFVVVGSTSPEGTEASNAALAEQRARAAVDALREAGIAESRLTVGPALPPLPDRDAPAQRFVRVTPQTGALR